MRELLLAFLTFGTEIVRALTVADTPRVKLPKPSQEKVVLVDVSKAMAKKYPH